MIAPFGADCFVLEILIITVGLYLSENNLLIDIIFLITEFPDNKIQLKKGNSGTKLGAFFR